jgi:hypothetical protein
MRTSLSLRKDTLADLTPDELSAVAGGDSDGSLTILRLVTIEPDWTQVTW